MIATYSKNKLSACAALPQNLKNNRHTLDAELPTAAIDNSSCSSVVDVAVVGYQRNVSPTHT